MLRDFMLWIFEIRSASMANSIRLFIAIKIQSTPALEVVLQQLERLGRPVTTVAKDQLHVTLKFLGDTQSTLIPNVAQVLQETAAAEAAFNIRLVGTGAFPHLGRPSVIWAGLQQAAPLVQMQGRLEQALEPLGFARESRPFHPHLTLARVKARPPHELTEIVKQHEFTDFGMAAICSVELYQSELKPQGPQYTVLQSMALEM
jgi:RNA 2',3'-cyclic 3'-phosphodiesterase